MVRGEDERKKKTTYVRLRVGQLVVLRFQSWAGLQLVI